MFKLMLFLHLLTAIFAIGPLVHLTTTAARGLRTRDASATASAARGTRVYGAVSVLVVIFGFGLMSMDSPYGPGKVAEFSEPFIWISVILWLVAAVLCLAIIEPSLKKATAAIGSGESVDSLKARVAASGGAVGLIFAVIVALMVYRPGS